MWILHREYNGGNIKYDRHVIDDDVKYINVRLSFARYTTDTEILDLTGLIYDADVMRMQ